MNQTDEMLNSLGKALQEIQNASNIAQSEAELFGNCSSIANSNARTIKELETLASDVLNTVEDRLTSYETGVW